MEQKDIQNIWDIAVFLQMMASFCDDINFDEYILLQQNLHKLIKEAEKETVEKEIPSYAKDLNEILEKIKIKYPAKRAYSDIAIDWNNKFVENKEFLSSGISIGWLEEQIDLKNYYRYDYTPYHFKVGLVIHKGRGEIEENFLLQDSFTCLVKAKRQLKKLEDCGEKLKQESILKGKNKFDQQDLDYLNFVKYEVSFYSRMAVVSFFSFLESFVNSIGFDYYYRHKEILSEKEAEILQGSKNGRFLNLKYKIESFQKIIRSDKKSVIVLSDENQIIEPFKSLFDYYEELRNSSVHFSPNKSRIWLKPHDWVERAEQFSKLIIEAAALIWKSCHETNKNPDYLGRLEYERLYKMAERRGESLDN
jgi:hypothetical protein